MTNPDGLTPGQIFATPREVKRQAASWSDEVLECRVYGHIWRPQTAAWNTKYHYWHVVRKCPRCTCERVDEMLESGELTSSSIRYPDGYLAQGIGRIAKDGRNTLRVEVIQRTFVVDQLRGKKADAAKPRRNTAAKLGEAA